MTLLNRLERHIGWITIGNLPVYIVSAQAMVYVWAMINPGNLSYLVLLPEAVIQQNEYWRLFTFLFVTPIQNPIFAFFYLYLLYIYGTALETEWGSFPFTLFYLVGGLGTIVSTFISSIFFYPSYSGAFYLNSSIFLAFAAIHPNFVIHLFFVLPVKIKWLAYLAWFFIGFSFLTGSMANRITILVSMANYFLFFARSHYENIQEAIRLYKHRSRFKDWNK